MMFILGATVLSALAIIYIQHLQTKAHKHELRAAAFEAAVSEQKKTIDFLQAQIESHEKLLEDREVKLYDARREAYDANLEINRLRITENAALLKRPFERGNAAADRIRAMLMRVYDTRRDKNSPDVH